MQLRNHPAMTRKSGVVNWPPQWRAVALDRGVLGEVGTLEAVSMNDLIGNKIFIAMQHMSERYVAVLAFDDENFTKQLYSALLEHTGRTMRESGDLDLFRHVL
jgi:hypothetical protein